MEVPSDPAHKNSLDGIEEIPPELQKQASVDPNEPKPTVEKPDVPPDPTCPFNEVGCNYQGKKGTKQKEVQTHIKKEPIKHLNLLCDTVLTLIDEANALQMMWEDYISFFDTVYKRHDRLIKRYGSHLLWKIDGYSDQLGAAKAGVKSIIFSPPFVTARHGYKLIVSAALNGDGKARGKFMSVFVSIMQGDQDSLLHWPFRHAITITLLDQSENLGQRNDVTHVVKPNVIDENEVFLGRPKRERNASFGIQRFIDLDGIQNLDYIKEDALFLKVQIDEQDIDVI